VKSNASQALARLPRAHPGISLWESDTPIVLAEYNGAIRLLDGNHRINRWVSIADSRTHPVNIHTINALGTFIRLPSIIGCT
jgi:hypothetical protein